MDPEKQTSKATRAPSKGLQPSAHDRRGSLALVTCGLLLTMAGAACCGPARDKKLTRTYKDDFERTNLGSDYFDTIGRYRIVKGRLNIEKAYNNPLWLTRRLPRNVEVQLDVRSRTKDGDIKVELFGDGRTFAKDRGSYVSTGYVLCMGGWNNSKSFIARRFEHGKFGRQRTDIVVRTDVKVQKDRWYHWRILRRDKRLEWYVDGELFLSYDDPDPLEGPGHEHFGFNNWQSDVWFDNLVIKPLD